MMTNEQVLQKMEEDFLLRGSSEKTRHMYRTALIRFSGFAGKDRYSDLDEKDLRSFLLHLHQEAKFQGSSINTYNAGCKFFLGVVLSLAVNRKQVPNVRARHILPVHFRVEQLTQFFAHLNEIRAFAFFLTLYGTGMRIFELTKLKCTDIKTDKASGLRFLRIPQGKRNKERRVILPEACYYALRHYWRQYRPGTPENWMFPARKTTGCLKSNVFTHEFKTCLKHSRLPSEFHHHSIRHSFSTHYIQNDPNAIPGLKHILGHASLASTEIYISISMVDNTNTMGPSEICDMPWAEYTARHVDTPAL